MSDEWDGTNRRTQRWKLDKQISVADIVGVAMAAAAGLGLWTNLNTRLAVVEDHQTQQASTDRRQDDDAQRYEARIDTALSDINRKLDRIIERNK